MVPCNTQKVLIEPVHVGVAHARVVYLVLEFFGRGLWLPFPAFAIVTCYPTFRSKSLKDQPMDTARDELADHLEAVATQAVTALRLVTPTHDWLDQLLDPYGDGLKSDEAAYVAGVSVDTARRRAEAAALTNKPIGILMAGAVWLFSLRRLLDAIELKDGRPGRLAAQSRAEKNAVLRFQLQNSACLPVATAR
jgi:hypothetical protein